MGDGVAIIPEEGVIYSPVDAMVEIVMETKHAVGLRTQSGTGILIHVGIDTVNLEGKYFSEHICQGQTVKKGELLLEFDQEKIKEAGFDTTTSLIVTELTEGYRLKKEKNKRVKPDDQIIQILKKGE